MREVILARSAGFCFGVRRAVELAEETADSGRPFVMLGPVIHNEAVIRGLEAKGVPCVDRVEDVPPGTGVIIRSHGEGRAVYEALEAKGCPVVDATCVRVKKIHQIASDASARGRQVIIPFGSDHIEAGDTVILTARAGAVTELKDAFI